MLNKFQLCSFNVTYGDQKNLDGVLVRESISIQLSDGTNISSSDATFGAIYTERPAHGFQSHEVDGILGMGFTNLNMAVLIKALSFI